MKRQTKLGCGLGAGSLMLALLGLGVREVFVRLDPKSSRAGLSVPAGPPGIPWDHRAAEKLARAETLLRNARTLQAQVSHYTTDRHDGRERRRMNGYELRLARPNLYQIRHLRWRNDSLFPVDMKIVRESTCDGWFVWRVSSPRADQIPTFKVHLTDGSAPNPSGTYPLSGYLEADDEIVSPGTHPTYAQAGSLRRGWNLSRSGGALGNRRRRRRVPLCGREPGSGRPAEPGKLRIRTTRGSDSRSRERGDEVGATVDRAAGQGARCRTAALTKV